VELADAIEAHRSQARTPVEARDRAASQVRRALADMTTRQVAELPQWEQVIEQVAGRLLDPLSAAEALMDDLRDIAIATKTATRAERLEQAIHGGMAVRAFDAVAEFIERGVESGDWHSPATLMEDLFYSDELDALIPVIESRARDSVPFRRQMVYSSHGLGGKGGAAAERFLELAHEFEPEFVDELSR
jgi:hypothetical protein